MVEEVVDLKLAILGDTLVGKSALTFRFINNKFPTEHDTTIEDQYSITQQFEGFTCRLQILDTAGQDDYQTMLDMWINGSDGFLLIYSITDSDSFESAKTRVERIRNNKGFTDTIVMAGNKCDLEPERKVNRAEVEAYCREQKIGFMECSALNQINDREIFYAVTRLLLKKKYPDRFKTEEEPKKNCFCF